MRWLLVVCICAVGSVGALFLSPASWWAPHAVTWSKGSAQLTHATGTLARGAALLHVPIAGIETPITWSFALPAQLHVELGGGQLQVRSSGAFQVVQPVTLFVQHAQFVAPITLSSATGGSLRPTPGLVAQASAPFARVRLPQTQAQFEHVRFALDAQGTLTGAAQGDATVDLAGTLTSLSPTRGSLKVIVTPAGRNASFDAGVRSTLTAAGNNQFSYVLTFR